LKGDLSEAKINRIQGSLETLNILGHMPTEVNMQLETAQKEEERKNAKPSRIK